MQQEVSRIPGLTIVEDSVEDLELEKSDSSQNEKLKVTAACLCKLCLYVCFFFSCQGLISLQL